MNIPILRYDIQEKKKTTNNSEIENETKQVEKMRFLYREIDNEFGGYYKQSFRTHYSVERGIVRSLEMKPVSCKIKDQRKQ